MAERRAHRLRRAGLDDLGLRRAMSDRLLPLLVAAMAFLAALALTGFVATAGLAAHWQAGAQAALTVQVPQPDAPAPPPNQGSRQARVVSELRGTPGIASARALSAEELGDLLRPWLGSTQGVLSALPLPGVVQVQVNGAGPDMAALAARLTRAAPGTDVESHDVWAGRLATLARSLQACAALALLVVTAVAAAVVAVATRSGLAARRSAIEIVHGLGATDGYISARFAARATKLAAAGAAAGAVAALPVLVGLAVLAAPFGELDGHPQSGGWLQALPAPLWLVLPGLPLAAAAIGWITAQGTVRRWLRRLP